MKKILLTTTALTLIAGAAAAGGISVSGDARFGVYSNGSTVQHRTRVNFAGSGETDGGIAFGANLRIGRSSNAGGGTGTWSSTDSGTWTDTVSTDNQNVWISSGGLKLQVGSGSGAMKGHARSSFWFGFDSVTAYGDNNIGHGGDGGNIVAVTYSAGNLRVGVSSDYSDTEIAANFNFGSGSVGVGTSSNGDWMAAAQFSTGAASFSVGTNSDGDSNASVSYGMGNTTLGLGWESGGDIGVNAAMSLGGGATAIAAFNNNGVASVGMSLGF